MGIETTASDQEEPEWTWEDNILLIMRILALNNVMSHFWAFKGELSQQILFREISPRHHPNLTP